MKAVRLYRVQYNSLKSLPKGFAEGALIAFTDSEIEAISKNPLLAQCFEPVAVAPESIVACKITTTKLGELTEVVVELQGASTPKVESGSEDNQVKS